MLPVSFFMRPNHSRTNASPISGRFVYKNPEDDRFASQNEMSAVVAYVRDRENTAEEDIYEELMKGVNSIVTRTIFEELSRGPESNIIFNPGEDNSQFVDKEGEATKLLQRIVAKAAEEALTFMRTNIKSSRDLRTRVEDDGVFIETFKWGLIRNMQALINRSKTELLLVEGGYCSLMEGFVNCNSKFGKSLYGQIIKDVYERMAESGIPSSMLFVDLDDFGKVNKQFGQDVGDEALRRTADLITKALRARNSDQRVRFGGEEIGILMERTTQMQGVVPAERIRKTLEENPMYLRQHIGTTETGDIKKSNAASIKTERFEELMQENGIESIELGKNVQIPDNLKELLKDKPVEVTEDGRGLKLILPDERDENSKIVLLYIPITASIGIAEFSPELMSGISHGLSDIEEAKDIGDLKECLKRLGIIEKGAIFTADESSMLTGIIECDSIAEMKKHMKVNGMKDEVFIGQIKEQLKLIAIKRSFTAFRAQADAQMVYAKKNGKNCIAVNDFIVDSYAIEAMREEGMLEKGRKSLVPDSAW